MKRLAPLLAALSLFGAGAVAAPAASQAPQAHPVVQLKTCGNGYTRAVIGGAVKCLHGGQFCAKRYATQYRRYGYVCKPGSDGRFRLFRR